jgi:hypothetical protein
MDKENMVYPCGGSFSCKWNEALIHVITWMNLENITLHEDVRNKACIPYVSSQMDCPE